MAVTSLGTAKYRPSVMSKLPGAVQSMQELNVKKEALQVQLADQELKKNKLNQQNTYKALENLSLHMNSLDTDADRMVFKQSDYYKQIGDLTKNYLPEYWNKEKKEVMLIPNKQMYEDKLMSHKVRLADTIASGGQLSPADMKLKDFLDKNDYRVAAAAIASAENTDEWYGASEQEKALLVQRSMNRLQKTRQSIYTDQPQQGNDLSQALNEFFPPEGGGR